MWRYSVFWLCFLLPPANPIHAGTPREEVLRLVPPNVGFCLLVENLRSQSDAFLQSRFAQRLMASPLGVRLCSSNEAKKLAQVKAKLERDLGIPLGQIRDEILGDAFALAYRPGSPGQDASEQGLFVVHARNPDLLARLLARIDRLHQQSGQLKELEKRVHRGTPYTCRRGEKNSTFRFIHGPLFVFATQESLLKEVIDRRATATGESPLAREFRLLGLENQLIALWVNPRAFDPAFDLTIERRAEKPSALRATALKTSQAYWRALKGLGISLAVKGDMELGLRVRVQPERLPEAARRLWTASAQASELWQRFPNNAILTVAGRAEVLAVAEMLADFLPEPTREAARAAAGRALGVPLRPEALRQLLTHIGPDMGLCIPTLGPEENRNLTPFVAAVGVGRGQPDSPAAGVLLSAVRSWAERRIEILNQTPPGTIRLQTETRDNVKISFVSGGRFPAGLAPAFAFKGGYLLLASNPDAIARFPAAAPSLLKSGDEIPLLRFSPSALAELIKTRRGALTAHLARAHQASAGEIQTRLDDVLGTLELFDRVELVSQRSREHMFIVLRLSPSRTR